MAKEEEATRTEITAAQETTAKEPFASKFLTPEGKPIRVLSTSLGIALLANAFLIPGAGATAAGSDTSADEPKLVAWSTEEVKQYFDKNVDWNIPLPAEEDEEASGETLGGGSADGANASNGSGGTTVINHYGGGFGWDDMLLYHLLFNSGSSYSSSRWYDNHRGYYAGTSTPYKPKTYSSETFQNKQMAGSVVRPKTSTSSTGSIVRRSTSSKAGGIGGKSSSLGSSSSSSTGSSKSSISGSRSSGTSKGFFGG
ncbi:hypothetical protein POTG_00822 [Paenibacillus sp. oral taxon 786 str. D14]|uniref:hypothetical protein n=1 Tax=Paenibacillus sp. oral taxon 786 TaxID=652715 RepID=UPI0001AFCC51|nr:hypothetical protein [Paenibacillus sp. oral taxon 786]EES74542.1 hypothetical protein POTG_00822 [Paenibacillus sp. oral taxon 786 str. D14]